MFLKMMTCQIITHFIIIFNTIFHDKVKDSFDRIIETYFVKFHHFVTCQMLHVSSFSSFQRNNTSAVTMVLIAAAVCSKSGKAIISRQFVELTKSRIEGLVAAFPKLMTAGKQHTFVETDSVRLIHHLHFRVPNR